MSFWSTVQTANSRYELNAETPACVGPEAHQFLMGGVAMASAIDVAEKQTGKPLLWATIQFVSNSKLGDTLKIECEERGGGRSIAQVGVSSRVEDRLVQHMCAALGARASHADRQFAQMPEVPPPQDCPDKSHDAFAQEGNLLSMFERRTAFEDNDAGIEHMWIRPTFDTAISAPLLALISDFFLGAHPNTTGGTSLDNTFRLNATTATDWILCATHLASFRNGAVHGSQFQFAQDGTLLSTSSQTGLLPRNPGAAPG